jgi:hypothetical protein
VRREREIALPIVAATPPATALRSLTTHGESTNKDPE